MVAQPECLLFASTAHRQGEAEVWSYGWETEDIRREKLRAERVYSLLSVKQTC